MKALAERVPVFLLEHLHSRYYGDRDKAYTDSYRAIRLMVGFLGVLLPVIFIIGEAFLRGSVHFRGSLSAYYHTSMQDVFVGGLCTIGLLLITYMAGERKSPDFWASVIAGVALLGVVFFPTSRPGLPAPACGSVTQTPPGCSFVEQALGEHTTAVIHAVFAIVFIIFLAVMSFLFAISEVETVSDKEDGVSLIRQPRRRLTGRTLSRIHGACAIIILVAGAWVFVGGALGANIWELTPLYVGEVVSVLAFALSWLLAGFYMTASSRFGPVQAPYPPAKDAVIGQLWAHNDVAMPSVERRGRLQPPLSRRPAGRGPCEGLPGASGPRVSPGNAAGGRRRAPRAPSAPRPVIAKDPRAYSTLSLRQEKSLRDHGMTESGMMPCVNTDTGDMRVSAVQETEPAAGTQSAGPRDSCLELVATFRYRLSLLVASVPGLRTRGSRGDPAT